MQHVLKDCSCCELYMAVAEPYDKLTAMVYDILVRGARADLKPYLDANLNPIR